MRERQFIEQNKDKWKEFEALINSAEQDPERLGDLFVQVTDDLSYARTFYPNRSVRVYLNALSQRVIDRLYSSRRKRKNRLSDFLLVDVPSAVYHARKELLLSLVIFTLSVLAGVLSGMKNPAFAKSVLGESYVSMTEENIDAGDPMAVYKDGNQFYFFARIALNNLRIDFYTFVSGLFFGLWTIIMLVSNGVMVGCFQYFFAERGLFSESFLTIWMHGTFEMSAAVIAGGAGLILGRGIVFPGTYSRLQSLMIAAREGLKILLVAVAMTTFAAIIESFFTRYTEIPNIVRAAFIAICGVIVLVYFVALPYMRWRSGTIKPRRGRWIMANREGTIWLDRVKTISQSFSDGFSALGQFYGRYMVFAVAAAVGFTALNLGFNYEGIHRYFHFQSGYSAGAAASMSWTFDNLASIFSPRSFWSIQNLLNVLLVWCCISGPLYMARHIFSGEGAPDSGLPVRALAAGLGFSLLVNGFLVMENGIVWVLLISPLPWVLWLLSGWTYRPLELGQTGRYLNPEMFRSLGLHFAFVLLGVIVFTLLTYPVFSIAFGMAEMFFALEGVDADRLFVGGYLFFSSLALLMILPQMVMVQALSYFSGREVVLANGLRDSLSAIIRRNPDAA